jgi:hypothetical protein
MMVAPMSRLPDIDEPKALRELALLDIEEDVVSRHRRVNAL